MDDDGAPEVLLRGVVDVGEALVGAPVVEVVLEPLVCGEDDVAGWELGDDTDELTGADTDGLTGAGGAWCA